MDENNDYVFAPFMDDASDLVLSSPPPQSGPDPGTSLCPLAPDPACYSIMPANPTWPVCYQPVPVTGTLPLKSILEMAKENSELKNQCQRDWIKEEKYKRLIKMNDGFHVLNQSGGFSKITTFTFSAVKYIEYDPLYFREPVVEVTCNHGETGTIPYGDFLNTTRFKLFLETLSHSSIKAYSSMKKTIEMLQGFVASIWTTMHIPWFGGWYKADKWRYEIFMGFRTVAGSTAELVLPTEVPNVSYEEASLAVRNYVKAWNHVDESSRIALMVWQHAAFLATPLRYSGYKSSNYFCICGNHSTQHYLRQLLAVGNAKAVPLDCDASEFLWRMLEAKDKPLLLEERPLNANAARNTEAFNLIIRSGRVILGKEVETAQSFFPVLLNAGESCLSFQRGAICMHPKLSPATDFHMPPTEGYWRAFASYVSEHEKTLEQQLTAAEQEACKDADPRELSNLEADTLAILYAVAHLVTEFWNTFDAPNGLFPSDWRENLLTLLEESYMNGETLDGLSDIFVEAARHMIRNQELKIMPKGSCEQIDDPRGCVYWRENCFCFDQKAFRRVCNRIDCNENAVKQALREDGCLLGKSVNGNSYQTRISRTNVHGIPRQIPVYAIDSNRLEKFGEPPLL